MHGSMKVKNNAGSFLSESTSNEFPYRNVNSRGFIAVVSWIMIGNTHEGWLLYQTALPHNPEDHSTNLHNLRNIINFNKLRTGEADLRF